MVFFCELPLGGRYILCGEILFVSCARGAMRLLITADLHYNLRRSKAPVEEPGCECLPDRRRRAGPGGRLCRGRPSAAARLPWGYSPPSRAGNSSCPGITVSGRCPAKIRSADMSRSSPQSQPMPVSQSWTTRRRSLMTSAWPVR